MINNQRIAVIVPAYNEEPTIADVIAVLKSSPLLDEIIVVSDGSTDHTADVARAAGAMVYELLPNVGKGHAMRYGVAQTTAPIVVFIDADLRRLTANHIAALVTPVAEGTLAMNIGMQDRGAIISRFVHHLPLISGQRAMRREIIEAIPEHFLNGFMAETSLTYYCKSHHLAYGTVPLIGLSMRRKYEKVGWPKGVIEYIKMSTQIIVAMARIRIAHLFGKF